ncbi:hypothetical protein OHA21_05555 [Actinoplanes sp. NBC_00393]|uniref:hypothetical protein n=1 Tax=Actinoplanes sp. NBC_00393 TaxID=2975953 RepID=UPI002E24FA33
MTEVFSIAATTSPPSDPPESSGWRRSVSAPHIGALVGMAGLGVAIISAFIGYASWRGDEKERQGAISGASSASPSPAGASPSPSPPVGPLRFKLDSERVDAHTVEVTPTSTGAARKGLTYWFVVAVSWGDGNTDYYPRFELHGDDDPFLVTIPEDASADATRTGRVYAFNAQQTADAKIRVERQKTRDGEDFFPEDTGDPVSTAVPLPFG